LAEIDIAPQIFLKPLKRAARQAGHGGHKSSVRNSVRHDGPDERQAVDRPANFESGHGCPRSPDTVRLERQRAKENPYAIIKSQPLGTHAPRENGNRTAAISKNKHRTSCTRMQAKSCDASTGDPRL
jgi:hypothetical protein